VVKKLIDESKEMNMFGITAKKYLRFFDSFAQGRLLFCPTLALGLALLLTPRFVFAASAHEYEIRLCADLQALLSSNASNINLLLQSKLLLLQEFPCPTQDQACLDLRSATDARFLDSRDVTRRRIRQATAELYKMVEELRMSPDPKIKALERSFRSAIYQQETSWRVLERIGDKVNDLDGYGREILSAERSMAAKIKGLTAAVADLDRPIGSAPAGAAAAVESTEKVEELSSEEYQKKKATFEAYQAEQARQEKARAEAETERRRLLEEKASQQGETTTPTVKLRKGLEDQLKTIEFPKPQEILAMMPWHKEYISRIAPLDSALAGFVGQDRRHFTARVEKACSTLDDVLVALIKKKIPPAPSLAVSRSLNALLQEVRIMTNECLERRIVEADKRLATVDEKAKELEVAFLPFGLPPWPLGYPRYEAHMVRRTKVRPGQ
jgi:hypothetical protein